MIIRFCNWEMGLSWQSNFISKVCYSSYQEANGWEPSDRGVSYRFGPDIVEAFLAKNNLSLIVRAHQVVEDGYEFFNSR